MNSMIKWVGGKRLLRRQILAEFPEKPSCYVEVFGGAAWILFAKDRHAEVEVYNDINHDLVNLFRCVKYHGEELYEELRWDLASRELFDQAKEDMKNPGLSDIQRAARFFLLVKCSYGAKMGEFSAKRVSFSSTIDSLALFRKRLNTVVVEQLDFEKLISLYDREGTLFYADPPYYETEGYYAEEFKVADHLRLKGCLDRVRGKFLLTYNDCPYIRELYRDYRILPIERQNNMTAATSIRGYQEIIIKNFG